MATEVVQKKWLFMALKNEGFDLLRYEQFLSIGRSTLIQPKFPPFTFWMDGDVFTIV